MGRFFHTHKHLHTHSHTHTDRQTEPRESGVLKKGKIHRANHQGGGHHQPLPSYFVPMQKASSPPCGECSHTEGGGGRRTEEEGGGGEGIPRRWKSQGGGTLRRWNSQRSGTPEAGPGGGTPRGVELLGGGSPREVELPGGRRVELPGGGTRRREFLSAGHLKTQAQIPMRVYIYILLFFIQCKEEISANAQICTEGKGFCLKCEAYFWHRS